MGVPGSPVSVTWTGIHLMRVECGLVVESWVEADHFGRLEQMGLIPIPSEAEAPPPPDLTDNAQSRFREALRLSCLGAHRVD